MRLRNHGEKLTHHQSPRPLLLLRYFPRLRVRTPHRLPRRLGRRRRHNPQRPRLRRCQIPLLQDHPDWPLARWRRRHNRRCLPARFRLQHRHLLIRLAPRRQHRLRQRHRRPSRVSLPRHALQRPYPPLSTQALRVPTHEPGILAEYRQCDDDELYGSGD